MTTVAWSARIRHDSDATFREWGLDLRTRMVAAGLVNTADTGQINFASVVRAGTNANAGYDIFRFADTQQATAPIYIRVDYGTGSSTTAPRVQFTIGTGTNGAGTVTGTALTISRPFHSSAVQTTDTLRNSYICVVDGFLGIFWKAGSSNTIGFLAVCRTIDASGVATATGAMVVWGGGIASSVTATQALRFAATAQAFPAQTAVSLTALGLNPQGATSTAVGTDLQVFVGFTVTPRVEPLVGVCGILQTEFTPLNTFTATLVGSTPRTYLALETAAGTFGPVNTTIGPGYAMLWE